MAKYTDDEVREVVALYRSGLGVRLISRLVRMSESHIEQILEGKVRVSVTGGRVMWGRRNELRAEAARRGWELKKERETR